MQSLHRAVRACRDLLCEFFAAVVLFKQFDKVAHRQHVIGMKTAQNGNCLVDLASASQYVRQRVGRFCGVSGVAGQPVDGVVDAPLVRQGLDQ
ncbi:hypothetical protein ACFZB2_38715 [Streptomyces bobili]|uniref:hypothetical protein n=1 Tax=Streptomyces bobili TaxID=67280 RepID=UPI0036E9F32A